MKAYKFFLSAAVLVLWCGTAAGAGLSTKTNYSKTLQNMHADESADLRKVKSISHGRVNWDERLNLDDAQKLYLKKILEESKKQVDSQMEIIRHAHDKIDEIHRSDDEKIRAILNPKQKVKFDRIKYEMQKSSGGKPQGKKPSRKRMRQY